MTQFLVSSFFIFFLTNNKDLMAESISIRHMHWHHFLYTHSIYTEFKCIVRKNDFTEVLKILLDSDLKIILLDY